MDYLLAALSLALVLSALDTYKKITVRMEKDNVWEKLAKTIANYNFYLKEVMKNAKYKLGY